MWPRWVGGLSAIAFAIWGAARIVFRYDRLFVDDARSNLIALRAELAEVREDLDEERERCNRLELKVHQLEMQIEGGAA